MQKRWLIMALRAFGALIVVMTALSQGMAQTRPFTFQGYLRDNTGPVGGNRTMEFRIYSVATGEPAGEPLWNSGALPVDVRNGLFTVTLNTPASLWTGDARYLEIRVAGTPLTPRVSLNPTPYSSFAYRAPWSGLIGIPAGFADGIDNDTTYSAGAGLQLVGTTFSIAPNGVVTSMLADNAVISAKIADGAVTDTKLSTTGVAAGTYGSATQVAQFTVNAQGRITAVSNVSIAGAGLWAASGANIYNTNTGHVGVGTATPAYLLDVRGNRNTLLMNIVNANTGSTA
ncbi:MAG: hypothetical protein NZL85_05780, partial [Fimbriimonadales bacterium]|nr:hypothetical protein [Fimbriimonadales bacterium]